MLNPSEQSSERLNLTLQSCWGNRKPQLVTALNLNPKDPCTCIVYTWALKLLYRNIFKAQVYTI